MAIKFPLEKAVENLQLELKKRDVDQIIPCQVKLAMDVSGSFDDEHRGGYTQDLLNRFIPFSLVFDKDGVIDSYTFATRCGHLPLITEQNFDNYICNEVINCAGYNGGTLYTPVLKMIAEDVSPKDVVISGKEAKPVGFLGKLFGKKGSEATETQVVKGEKEKELIFFVTDGEAEDTNRAKQFLTDLDKDNLFFVFISVGERDISIFKDSFEDTPNSIYLRFTKKELKDLHTLTDEEIYSKLLKPSLIAWMDKEV